MSQALNPLPSAPLQHINSGTGTNCPTLDVLETQIASAASAPQTPPTQTPQHSNPKRRKPSKEESQNYRFLCARSAPALSSSKAFHVLLCVTVNSFRLVLQTSPSRPPRFSVSPFSDRFYSLLCLQADRQFLRMYLTPRRDLPTHAVHRHFLTDPVSRESAFCSWHTYRLILPSFANIFLQPCALNCELRSGCKAVSSTRLLLFTLSRLPSPRLHSASPHFKETNGRRGTRPERCFMILLGRRKHCGEGVGPLSVVCLS